MAIEKEILEKSKMPIDVLPEDVELEAQDLNPSNVDIQMTEDGGKNYGQQIQTLPNNPH